MPCSFSYWKTYFEAQNKRSFICKIRSPEHQDVLHEASKVVNAVWKNSIPYNELHIQPKIFTYVCWKANIHFLIHLSSSGEKKIKNIKPLIEVYEYGYSPVHTSFQIALSTIHIKPLCELEWAPRLNLCWYMCIHLVVSDHYTKTGCFGGLGVFFFLFWFGVFWFLVGFFSVQSCISY